MAAGGAGRGQPALPHAAGGAERVRPPRGGPPPAEGVKAAPGGRRSPRLPPALPRLLPAPGLYPRLWQGQAGRAQGKGKVLLRLQGDGPGGWGLLEERIWECRGTPSWQGVGGVALLVVVFLAAPGERLPPWSFPSVLRLHREPWVHLAAPR